jgi:hypothetical protein
MRLNERICIKGRKIAQTKKQKNKKKKKKLRVKSKISLIQGMAAPVESPATQRRESAQQSIALNAQEGQADDDGTIGTMFYKVCIDDFFFWTMVRHRLKMISCSPGNARRRL